jgi:hypothetical protein
MTIILMETILIMMKLYTTDKLHVELSGVLELQLSFQASLSFCYSLMYLVIIFSFPKKR